MPPKDNEEVSDMELEVPETPGEPEWTSTKEWEILDRLSRGTCWVCDSGVHEAGTCTQKVEIAGPRAAMTYKFARRYQGTVEVPGWQIKVNELHAELPWYRCKENECRLHWVIKRQIAMAPGHPEHGYITDCQLTTACYQHHPIMWEDNHKELGWWKCFRNECPQHMAHKVATGWYPEGWTQDATTTEGNQQESGTDAEHLLDTYWPDCQNGCLAHLCQKEQSAVNESNPLHRDLRPWECLVTGCRRHGHHKDEDEVQRVKDARCTFKTAYQDQWRGPRQQGIATWCTDEESEN